MYPTRTRGASLPRLIITVALLSLVAGYGLSRFLADGQPAADPGKQLKAATLLAPPKTLENNFQLRDHDGQPFNLDSLQGHWSFIFFGYTHCPDVCPITLKTMQSAWKKIPHQNGEARLYFVSVDPDRDTLDTLKKYTRYFDPSFVGVTGRADEIDKFTNQLGILYGFEDKDEKTGAYVVNHSAHIILLDPEGRWRAVLSPPYEANTIASDFQLIKKHSGD